MTAVEPKMFRTFYAQRRQHKTKTGDVITNNTLGKDATLIKAVLRYAVEEKHLTALPLIPRPGKIVANPRLWFTNDEFAHLVKVALNRIGTANTGCAAATRLV